MRRHLLAVVATVAMVVGVLAGTAAPASATTNLVAMINFDTAQCSDVYLGQRQDLVPVVSEPCAHYAEQMWWVYLTADGSGAFEFKNYLTDKCLAVTVDILFRKRAVQTTCHGGTEQQWTYNGSPTYTLPVPGNILYHFVNRRYGSCLSSDGANGAGLVLNSCGGANNQLWLVRN